MDRLSRQQLVEWLRGLFALDATKLVLSLLIIVSVLPFDWVQTYGILFFFVFGVELYGRLVVLLDDARRGTLARVEIAFFVVDAIATLSFLPLELLWEDIRILRLLRLTRMLLLLGYWGPVVREIWIILAKRERRYQLFLTGASIVILSFLAAVLLYHFHDRSVDFNEDGNTRNESFWSMLWWSFRQIESPDNLIRNPDASLGFFCSVLLTLSGLFLFSFVVGIATSVVEELVAVGRERRLGQRHHSVICNLGPFNWVLLQELVAYYTKALRAPKIVTMGSAPARYHYMHEPPLNRIRYRQGQPLRRHDLEKVDVDRARRVILLGRREEEASDSEIVSQVLSVREVNPSCRIHAELFRRDNVPAVLRAGGHAIVPVLATRLTSLFVSKIVAAPGVDLIYTELLTSAGDEIYTCLYEEGALAGRRPPSGPLPPFGELLERGYLAHGVILLGYLVADPGRPTGFHHVLNPGQGGPEVPDVGALRGFFGVAPSFERLRGLVQDLPDFGPVSQAPAPALPELGLCPSAATLRELLVCGFHEGLFDTCEQLILATSGLTIRILVPAPDQVDEVLRAFLRAHPPEPGVAPSPVRYTVGEGPGELHYSREEKGEERAGFIRVCSGDGTDEQTLIGHEASGHRLTETDAVLFTYDPGAADPDARTALGLIKLIHLQETRPALVKPGLRIVCEVQSTEKAMLLRARFAADEQGRAASSPCHPVTVIAAERKRNALLAQAVFVPGITTIYNELLTPEGQEVCRLIVTRPIAADTPLTFGQLLAGLYQRDGVILLGVELAAEGGAKRSVVNPHPRSPDSRFLAGEIRCLYVVGEYSLIPRAGQACADCFTVAAR